MTQILLHAGLPKTGTTTIQNWLVKNAEALRDAGVFTFGATHFGHRLAVAAISDKARMGEADIPPLLTTDLSYVLSDLRNAANDHLIRTAVISSEYFSIADPSLVKKLLGELSLHDVTIIIVLRRQDRYIESNYNQSVRMMEWTLPIGKPVYHEGYNWDVLAYSWEDEFGRENIALRLYDELDLTSGGLVYQVFGPLDASLARLARDYAPVEARSNPSLPAALVEFKRLANSVGAYDVLPMLERASEMGAGGPPFRMRREIAKGFLDIYRESNRKVARRFFHREGDLFDESDLEGEPAGADYTGRLPVETIAMLLALHLQSQAEHSRTLQNSIERLEAKVEEILRQFGKVEES